MSRIFSEVIDSKTVTKNISSEAHNDRGWKAKLLPGQKQIFQCYEMLDKQSNLLGYIIAANQKVSIDATEFVFGLDSDKKIRGIYIQRVREILS